MNHTRTIQRRWGIVALIVVVSIVLLSGLAGGSASSSAGQVAVTRSPRPHPQSHIRLILTAPSISQS